jgi:hypothetical protein
MAVGTLLWQCELGSVGSGVVTINVEAHARRSVVVNVVRVVLWVVPRKDLEEDVQ